MGGRVGLRVYCPDEPSGFSLCGTPLFSRGSASAITRASLRRTFSLGPSRSLWDEMDRGKSDFLDALTFDRRILRVSPLPKRQGINEIRVVAPANTSGSCRLEIAFPDRRLAIYIWNLGRAMDVASMHASPVCWSPRSITSIKGDPLHQTPRYPPKEGHRVELASLGWYGARRPELSDCRSRCLLPSEAGCYAYPVA